jgi:hypothetical protein
MRRRRHHRRRTRHPFVRAIVAVVLILWIGLLLLGMFSRERPSTHNPADLAPDTTVTKSELGSRQKSDTHVQVLSLAEQHTDAAPAPSSQASAANGNVADSSDTSARANDRITKLPMPAVFPKPARVAPSKSKAPDAVASAGKTSATSADQMKPRTQTAQDVGPKLSVADIAPLKTKPKTNVSSPHVTRAQFTTGIKEREPIDKVGSVFPINSQPLRTLYYFTEIVNMSGETITHRWERAGRLVAEVSLNIGSNRWRTWSSKDLTPVMKGSWRVVVSDSQGHVLKTDNFSYRGP